MQFNSDKPQVDFSALVDIISNMGGMMIMFACIAVMLENQLQEDGEPARAKPIAYPLPYLPEKSSVTICLRHGRCYELPQRQLLEGVVRESEKGVLVESLKLEHGGVRGEVEVARLYTGFRFHYALLPDGGVPVDRVVELTTFLNNTLSNYPKDRYFVSLRAWPEDFRALRDVREFLLEQGYEVGWSPGFTDTAGIDISYAIGDYDENLTSIKAQ